MKNTKEQFAEYANVVEKYIESSREARKEGVPEELFEAMEYSLTAGGKRLRPVLCIAAAEACGAKRETALAFGLGFEMLHTATLIHDDLPCMDNDDMRRGKPSNHAKFGEMLAVLAADALLGQSFEYALSFTENVPAQRVLSAMKVFTHALGPAGVCGGQLLDMRSPSVSVDGEYVRKVAALKTGELIKAAIVCGAALATDDASKLEAFEKYGKHLGAAFQIVDDILDVNATAEELGKTPGKDAEQGKVNYVTAYGVEKAKELAKEESIAAKKALEDIVAENSFLTQLPEWLVSRTY